MDEKDLRSIIEQVLTEMNVSGQARREGRCRLCV